MSRGGYHGVCHLCLEPRGICASDCPSWVGFGRGDVARALRTGHWVPGVHPNSPILLEVMTTEGAKRQRLDDDLSEALRVQQRVQARRDEVVRAHADLIEALRVQHNVEMQHAEVARAQAAIEHGRLLARLNIEREQRRLEAEIDIMQELSHLAAEIREPEQEPHGRGSQTQPESEPSESQTGDFS